MVHVPGKLVSLKTSASNGKRPPHHGGARSVGVGTSLFIAKIWDERRHLRPRLSNLLLEEESYICSFLFFFFFFGNYPLPERDWEFLGIRTILYKNLKHLDLVNFW